MNRNTLMCLALALGANACITAGKRAAPQSPLERGIYFEERDGHGVPYGLSTKTPASIAVVEDGKPPIEKTVERVAHGMTVDVNSRLSVDVLKDQLAPSESSGGARVPAELQKRADAIRDIIQSMAGVIEARTAAIKSWSLLETSTDAFAEFSTKKRAFAKQERAFLTRINDLWPLTDPKREAMEELVGDFFAGSPDESAGLQKELQRQIDDLSENARAVGEEVKHKGLTLRIEAFLLPGKGKKDPTPIHVPGYDTLDQKEISRIDRFGLALTAPERESLTELSRTMREIAEAAERARKGETSFSEALSAATTDLGRRLGEYTKSIETLKKDIETPKLSDRIQTTKQNFQSFAVKLRAIVEAQAERISTDANKKLDALVNGTPNVLDAVKSMQDALALIEAWKNVNAGALPELLARSVKVYTDVGKLKDSFADLKGGLEGFSGWIETTLQALPNDLATRTKAEWMDPANPLREDLLAWDRLLRRALATLEPVQNLLSVSKLQGAPASLHTPGALDLPLADAPNTTIDIPRTPRQAGDSLEVRVSIIESNRARETSSQVFHLEKIGWHADIVPSVVLVSADQLTGDDDTGGFSAALSWMWSYGARDDEDGFLANSSRVLGWGLGLHAVFLNFDPDQDAEFGLGLTASLWDDVIQAGAGYNAMADEEHEGRYYYFIGSSLVPLLQALKPSTD